ncbi:S-layer homology domain-containing protein [Paenibacillus sp. HB172176]|uniref:RCC1 domain-containing protein n=1 Tax=Paenibacillus sp. HB172176 TaxID=2493690 RepID=UPI00143B36BE|nr:S-layer homology domain-containing protein [Paenibacillus sp. HB172176]
MERRVQRRLAIVMIMTLIMELIGFSGAKTADAAEAVGSRGITAIAAGYYHSLAINAKGGVIAWGGNDDLQSTVPEEAKSDVIAVAAGGSHSLALKSDGSVIAWGDNTFKKAEVPADAQSQVVAIAAGNNHSLALRSDGTVVGWGYNYYSQASLYSDARSDVIAIAACGNTSVVLKSEGRVVVSGNAKFYTIPDDALSEVTAIACGGDHILALRSDGRVVAWGANNYGQATVPDDALSDIVAISAGYLHSVALKSNGRVIAWGNYYDSQTTIPNDAKSDVIAISGGAYHNLALRSDGRVVAWGRNANYQSEVPEEPVQPVKAARIAAGQFHSLALKSNGSVEAWGRDDEGQVTVPNEAQSGVTAIAAGALHSLALNSEGRVFAWGEDDDHQSTVPDEAKSGVEAIAAGDYFSLALKTEGRVLAWGKNDDDQATVPDEAKSGVKAIAGGDRYAMALKSDGSVAAWGYNGDGEATVPDEAKSGVAAIASGSNFAMALKSDGRVLAWGNNDDGRSTVPDESLSGVAAIAAGAGHALALKSDGSVMAWGNNDDGQSTVPAEALSGVVAIAASHNHSLALKADGSIVAWGAHDAAQDEVPGDANLSGLVIDAAGISPDFDADTTNYSVYVGASVDSVNVTATMADPLHADLYMDGEQQASGSVVSVPLTDTSTVITTQVEPFLLAGKTYALTVIKDEAAPTISFGVNGSDTYAASASTSVSVSDGESGVDGDSLEYAWTQSANAPDSGVTWTSFESGDSIARDGVDGDWYLHVHAADGAGNAVETATNRFRLDNSDPVVTIELEKEDTSSYASGSWTNQNVAASVSASDDLSGLASLQVSLDSGSTWLPYSVPLSFTDEGVHTLTVKGVDLAGNSHSESRTVNISRSGLQLEVTMKQDGGMNYTSGSWVNQPVMVTVNANQTTPGVTVASATYSLDGGTNWAAYVAPLSFGSEGEYTLEVKAEDSAGNGLTSSTAVRIDTTVPVIHFAMDGNEVYAASAATAVTVSDGGSGVDASSLQYIWTPSASAPDAGEAWAGFASGDTLSRSHADGEWYLHVKAKDAAGNEINTGTYRFLLDHSAPVVTYAANGDETNRVEASTIVDVSDSGSGVDSDSLQYIWTQSASTPDAGDAWTGFASGDTLAKRGVAGDWYLHVQAADPLGNRLDSVTNRFRLYLPAIPSLPTVSSPSPVYVYDANGILLGTINNLQKTTRSDGTVIEQVSIDEATWHSLLNRLEQDHFTIRVDDSERAVEVQLPAASLLNAAKDMPNFTIEVQLNGSSYGLAIRALDLEGIAERLGVDFKDLTVTVTLERVDPSTEEKVGQLAANQGLRLVSGVIDFKVTVQAGDQSLEITDFGGTYMARGIVPNESAPSGNGSNQNGSNESATNGQDTNGQGENGQDTNLSPGAQKIIGVWYDPANGTFTFLPSQSRDRSDGTEEIVMNMPHNSMYALVETSDISFADIGQHWAKADIELLATSRIVKGMDQDHFAPDANITRAEFTALLVRALGIVVTAAPSGGVSTSGLADVSSDAWYEPAVTAAVNAELIQGYADGSFGPNQPIRREELAVLIERARTFVNNGAARASVSFPSDSDTGAEQLLNTFADQERISAWARQAAANLLHGGLMQGRSEERFEPQAYTTRAEAVVLLKRFLMDVGLV